MKMIKQNDILQLLIILISIILLGMFIVAAMFEEDITNAVLIVTLGYIVAATGYVTLYKSLSPRR